MRTTFGRIVPMRLRQLLRDNRLAPFPIHGLAAFYFTTDLALVKPVGQRLRRIAEYRGLFRTGLVESVCADFDEAKIFLALRWYAPLGALRPPPGRKFLEVRALANPRRLKGLGLPFVQAQRAARNLAATYMSPHMRRLNGRLPASLFPNYRDHLRDAALRDLAELLRLEGEDGEFDNGLLLCVAEPTGEPGMSPVADDLAKRVPEGLDAWPADPDRKHLRREFGPLTVSTLRFIDRSVDATPRRAHAQVAHKAS